MEDTKSKGDQSTETKNVQSEVRKIFDTMDYGKAPESDAVAKVIFLRFYLLK